MIKQLLKKCSNKVFTHTMRRIHRAGVLRLVGLDVNVKQPLETGPGRHMHKMIHLLSLSFKKYTNSTP
jgi:hypothetical protein